MGRKDLLKWFSGLWTGIFIGALIACPAKAISIPTSLFLAALFAFLGWRK